MHRLRSRSWTSRDGAGITVGEGPRPQQAARADRISAPSLDSSLGTKLLPSVLSVTAGSVDVVSFLELGGLFTAHITGNLVILAAHVVSDGAAQLAPMLSVPVFMFALGVTRLLASGLE